MAFGDRIKELRKQKGWSQITLAEKSGLNRNSIYSYENSKAMPRMPQMKALATALEVSIDELTGWDDLGETLAMQVQAANEFENYLSTLGYSVKYDGDVTEWHYEDVTDDAGNIIGRAQVADGWNHQVEITKGKEKAIFTSKEYTALQTKFFNMQSDTQTVIETRIHKKAQSTKPSRKENNPNAKT